MRFHGGSSMKWRDVDDLGATEEESADEERSLKVQEAPLSDRLLIFKCTLGTFVLKGH